MRITKQNSRALIIPFSEAIILCLIGFFISFEPLQTFLSILIILGLICALGLLIKKPKVIPFLLVFTTPFSREIPITTIGSKLVTLNFDLIVIPLGLFLMITRMQKKGDKPLVTERARKYYKLILAFALVGFLSVLKASVFDFAAGTIGGLYLAQFLLYLSIPLLITYFIRTQKDAKKLLIALFFSWGIMSFYWLWIYYGGTVPSFLQINPLATKVGAGPGAYRVRGFWGQDAPAIGLFSLLHISVALGILFFYLQSFKSKVLLLGALIISLPVLILTYSRASYLGLGASLVIIVGSKIRTSKLSPFMIAFTSSILAFALLFLAFLSLPQYKLIKPIQTRAISILKEGEYQIRYYILGDRDIPIHYSYKYSKKDYRVGKWIDYIPLIIKNPVLGTGFNTFGSAFGYGRATDNAYLGLLVCVGIAGLIIWVLIIRYVYQMVSELRRSENKLLQSLGIGFFGGFTGFLIWSITGDFFSMWRPLGPLFMYIGLMMSGVSIAKKLKVN